jgi:hypothetical protein
MPSGSFWTDACEYAENRPLQTSQDALRASGGVTVTLPRV